MPRRFRTLSNTAAHVHAAHAKQRNLHARLGAVVGGRHFSTLATMLLLLGASCRNDGWSADEVKQFYGICAGGRSDANCVCLARELPKLIPFAAYAEFVAASKGMSPHKLNDDVLRKMAHAAVICTSR